MNKLAALALVMALTACAEVTRFQRSDGSSVYYVDCKSTLRLFESCRSAALRTCPAGYTKVDLRITDPANPDFALTRCNEANEERRVANQPEKVCPSAGRNSDLFACR